MEKGRLGLYGAAVVVSAGLAWAGFVYPKTVPPDPLTLLGIARLHLGLAEILPDHDNSGKEVGFRQEHLAKAREVLDRTEEVAPGLAITSEFRAFQAWIEGEFDESIRRYHEVIERAGDDTAMVYKTRVNLAQVQVAARRPDRGLAELAHVPESARDASWHLAEAKVWDAKGVATKRGAALNSAFDSARKEDEKTQRVVADTCFELGDAIALSCYERLEHKDATAWYRIARLKVATGDPDSAGSALSNVRDLDSALLDRLLESDAAYWEPYRDKGLLERLRTTPDAGPTKPGK